MKGKTPTPARPRILLVEDHAIVREGLKLVLQLGGEFTVCAECADAAVAMDAMELSRPDVAVIDISLGGTDGLELIKNIRARNSKMPILVLSMHDEGLCAERALKAGAQGYLMKGESAELLLDALRRVLDGEVRVSGASANRMIGNMVHRPRSPTRIGVDALSDREPEVFARIGHGETTAQIARALKISAKTVETHRVHIRSRIGVRSGHELVCYAIQRVGMEDRQIRKPPCAQR